MLGIIKNVLFWSIALNFIQFEGSQKVVHISCSNLLSIHVIGRGIAYELNYIKCAVLEFHPGLQPYEGFDGECLDSLQV